MTGYLVQAVSEDATADIGLYTQELFNQLLGIDIMFAFKMLVFWTFFIWIIFALWVAFDASSRYKSWQASLFWFVFVLPFNVIGFIGYLFMRPVVTLEDKQWTNLEGKFLMQELSNVNDCPTCGTLVGADQNFCAVCGTQMKMTCNSCDTSQSIYNMHCKGCGIKIQSEMDVAQHHVIEEKELPIKTAKFNTAKIKSFIDSLFAKQKKQNVEKKDKKQKNVENKKAKKKSTKRKNS